MNQKLSCIFVLAVAILLTVSCNTYTHRTFYINSQSGNDANSGLSPEKAWVTLAHVNEQTLLPGDQVLVKTGTSYNGQLEIKGKGTALEPIIISSYGAGEKPVIHGNGLKKYTLRIHNSEYVEVKNLAVTNTGKKREADRVGVLVEAINCGDMRHIVLDSLDVHDVNGSLVKKAGGGSAIFWRNGGDSIPSRFIGLQIENCHLYRCGRNGITSIGYYNRDKWYPSLKVVIRGNLLDEIPGDGIVPIGCDSALVEYNIMRNCPDSLSFDEAAAGFWPWSCDNTIIQYNEVSDQRAKWDGQGYDCDFNCRGTIIRYNYSHDNYGGFLLVCNPGTIVSKNENIGTTNSIIQYNLSINDGIRPYPTKQESWFSPAIHISGPNENTLISNNVFLIPPKTLKEIPVVLVKVGNWGDAWPTDTKIENNHILASTDPLNVWGGSVNTIYENNARELFKGRDKKIVLSALDGIISKSDSIDQEGYKKLRRFISLRIKAE